jgi:hypothetical protein
MLLMRVVIGRDDEKDVILNSCSLLASADGPDEASLHEPPPARIVVPNRDLLRLEQGFELGGPIGGDAEDDRGGLPPTIFPIYRGG